MTKNEAIQKILDIDDVGLILKVSVEERDKPCEFALMQLNPRIPVYQSIEKEIEAQEKLCGPLSIQMELTGKGDPRPVVMFCMGVLRECANTVTDPEKFAHNLLRVCVTVIYAFLWAQTWRLRLATAQTVRGINRLASPFHNEEGEKNGS